MSFVHPSCAAIVIVKWQRSSIMENKSIVFSIAVTMSVELLLIVISMAQGTFICYWRR
jgi:hypothetical protein